jgi:hypothetical protein
MGRPGDNLNQLSFIAARPTKLLIELEEHILLVLTEPRLFGFVQCLGSDRVRPVGAGLAEIRRHDASPIGRTESLTTGNLCAHDRDR